jgi:hypothetical protein
MQISVSLDEAAAAFFWKDTIGSGEREKLFNLDRVLEIISSLALTADRPMEPEKFHSPDPGHRPALWGGYPENKGDHRHERYDQRFIIQCVLLEGDRQRPWQARETRESRLVFIRRPSQGSAQTGVRSLSGVTA